MKPDIMEKTVQVTNEYFDVAVRSRQKKFTPTSLSSDKRSVQFRVSTCRR